MASRAFFNRLGATIGEKWYCESGSSTAWIMTVGPTGGLDMESLAYSKYIIVWAMNMMSTNLHAWPFILEAKKNGAKIVVIDPVRTRTAKQADWHIPIRPGTDGTLALGMTNVIIADTTKWSPAIRLIPCLTTSHQLRSPVPTRRSPNVIRSA
jgi:anaerobic selenocysteine-containing dehydrogenase